MRFAPPVGIKETFCDVAIPESDFSEIKKIKWKIPNREKPLIFDGTGKPTEDLENCGQKHWCSCGGAFVMGIYDYKHRIWTGNPPAKRSGP